MHYLRVVVHELSDAWLFNETTITYVKICCNTNLHKLNIDFEVVSIIYLFDLNCLEGIFIISA